MGGDEIKGKVERSKTKIKALKKEINRSIVVKGVGHRNQNLRDCFGIEGWGRLGDFYR